MEMISSENSVIWAPVPLAHYLLWSHQTDLSFQLCCTETAQRWTPEELGSSQPGCPLICTHDQVSTSSHPSSWGISPPDCSAPPESSNHQVISPTLFHLLQTSTGLGHCHSWPLWETQPPHWGHSCTGLVVVWGIKTSFPPLSSHAFMAAQCTDKVGNHPTT